MAVLRFIPVAVVLASCTILFLSVRAAPQPSSTQTRTMRTIAFRVPPSEDPVEIMRQLIASPAPVVMDDTEMRVITPVPQVPVVTPVPQVPVVTPVPQMPVVTPVPSPISPPSGGNVAPVNPPGPPVGAGVCVSCEVENFNLVNDFRVNIGRVEPVAWNDALTMVAEAHSKVQFDDMEMKHSVPAKWENIARDFNIPWEQVAGKMFFHWETSEDGHRENMLRAEHKCVGTGIYGDGEFYFATQIFSSECV